MTPEIYPITTVARGQLCAMPMPAPDQLDETMSAMRQRNISIVVCLLEAQEMLKLGLQNESTACEAAGMAFRHFPIADFGVPQLNQLRTLVKELSEALAAGENVLVHCRGGIGRTGLVCTCILTASGMQAHDAIELVSNQRGCKVPETPAQLAMVTEFAQLQGIS